jgi:hypothetical protein
VGLILLTPDMNFQTRAKMTIFMALTYHAAFSRPTSAFHQSRTFASDRPNSYAAARSAIAWKNPISTGPYSSIAATTCPSTIGASFRRM